jgi:REP-associated tyrosine transposase
MARGRRFAPPGYAYHVVNRGNDRRCIFPENADCRTFLRLMSLGKARYQVKVFGVCLVKNHVHAVVEPECDGALSAYFKWVLGSYACYLRWSTGTIGLGHVFQGRFWCRGIEDSWDFLTVLRYIEANPARAHLIERAEHWPWSSLALRDQNDDGLLDPLPVDLPLHWLRLVNDADPHFDENLR